MKKFVKLLLSLSLVAGGVSPLGFNELDVNAQKKEEDEEDTISLDITEEEQLKLELDGAEEIILEEMDTEIELTISKHPYLLKTVTTIQLPKGVTYVEDNDNISLNDAGNELKITLDATETEVKIPLMLDHEQLNDKETILHAIVEEENHTIISNDFKLVMADKKTSIMDSETIVNPKDEIEKITTSNEKQQSVMAEKNQPATQNNTPTNREAEKTKSVQPASASNGMTTKDGVPNAPKPTKITHADPEKANEVDVSTWQGLIDAMNNQSINVIHLQDDFYNDKGTGRVNFYDWKPLTRNITVNGNGHIVDFRGTVFHNNADVMANHDIKWEFNNITMYGSDYYGPFQTSSNTNAANTSGQLVYNDVTYVGAQLTASYYWTIRFSGQVENHSVRSYISPFTNTAVTASSQENLEAADLVFEEETTYKGSTDNRRVFYLSGSGTMTVKDNAKVEVSGVGGTDVIYLQGVLTMEKNAELIVNSNGTSSQIAINIYGNGNGIKASENSLIKLNSNSPTGYVISMDARTFIHVDDGATLDIQTNNRATNTTNLINTGSNSEFIIGRKGIFNIISDSAGNHNLLHLGTTSKFQFADAEKVNMQFTKDNLNANARLISMAGSNGQLDVDVQDVKAWNRTNISTNAERDADYHWTPMFGMITKYSTGTSSVNQAESVMNTMRDDYTANFKTQNFSRLLYSYIEDVDVGIMNKPNDNVESTDSSVIHGVANPGAFVRLTGDPALPEPTVPSEVDGSDNSELTDNYTVVADASGKFTVHAKEGQHFTAANNIKAYAFLGGKMDEATFKVLDKTSPTAEGKTLTMADGTDFPTAKKFVMNEADTNPANDGYTYEFKEDYSALAHTPGTHQIIVVLKDEAGNAQNIPATIEVVADAYVVEADDFKINLSDLRQYNTDEKMIAFLLEQSKANAFGIIDFEKQELTNDLTVKSIASIDQFKKGKYDITLELISEGKTFTHIFTVTVLNDESVKPTNPEKPGTEEKPDEQENTGTGQKGYLKLDYGPSAFDFGTLEFGFNTTQANAIKTTSEKQWLQVTDDRDEDEITNWSIQVSENHELKNNNNDTLKGATITLPKGSTFSENDIGKDRLNASKAAITTEPTTVFSADVSESTKGTATNVWNATDVQITIPGNQDFEEGEYSNEITWTLVSEADDKK